MILAELTGVPVRAAIGADAEYVGYAVEAPNEGWWVMLHSEPGALSPLGILDTLFKNMPVRITVEIIDGA